MHSVCVCVCVCVRVHICAYFHACEWYSRPPQHMSVSVYRRMCVRVCAYVHTQSGHSEPPRHPQKVMSYLSIRCMALVDASLRKQPVINVGMDMYTRIVIYPYIRAQTLCTHLSEKMERYIVYIKSKTKNDVHYCIISAHQDMHTYTWW